MPATRNVRRIRSDYDSLGMPDSVGGSMGSSTGDGLGDELGFSEYGYRDLLSHVPDTTQSIAIPALARSVSATPLVETVSPLWLVSSDAPMSGMRPPTATPATTRAARSVAKSPYSRANTETKFEATLEDIIKNCPAVDVLLGGYAASRSSTHSRARDQEHVSRPPNAFMVYRSYIWFTKQLKKSDEKNLSCVSKLAADSWGVISVHARAPFHEIAALAKRKHAELYPDYKYAPSSRSEKPTRKNASSLKPKARKKAKAAATPTNEAVVAVASPLPRRATQTGRKSSAAFTSAVPASPVPSSSTSTASSSSASPPPPTPTPTPDLEYPYPAPSSPELGYPCDHDLPGFPSRPRFHAVSSGCIPTCIPSPAISVLELTVHESVLDSLPDKYEEAASYHDLQPHALLFNEGPPFDNIDPATQPIAPLLSQSIDYSCFISGNPDAKLVSPAASTVDHPDAPPLGGCAFSLDPCADIADPEHTFHSLPHPSLFDWPNFDMLTLGSSPAADEIDIYVQSLDPVFGSMVY